jgi:uncharacterized membrane protein YedE/YeeE
MLTVDWFNFTPLASLAGGALIGIAAVVLLLWHGRVAGISGIVGGLLKFERGDVAWRLLFVFGLLSASWVYGWFAPLPLVQIDVGTAMLISAGLLVGFGTRLGSGCTSGHGVCGNARFSLRSLVATLLFMAFGFLTVFVVRHLMQ